MDVCSRFPVPMVSTRRMTDCGTATSRKEQQGERGRRTNGIALNHGTDHDDEQAKEQTKPTGEKRNQDYINNGRKGLKKKRRMRDRWMNCIAMIKKDDAEQECQTEQQNSTPVKNEAIQTGTEECSDNTQTAERTQ